MITQHFLLHIVPDTIRPKIYISQRSTGLEKLQFTLVGTDGSYYSIPSDTDVTLVGTKPDKRVFSYACTYSGSTVSCDVTDQMSAVAGLVKAELRFANTSGQLLPSQNIDIIVERSPLDGTVCSKNDLLSVEDEVQSISQDAANAKRYADIAESAGTESVAAINAAVQSAETDIGEIKDSAIADLNSAIASAGEEFAQMVDDSETAINEARDEAIETVDGATTTVLAAFDEAVAYVQQYGTAGVAMEYDPTTESFRITSVTS